jgi:ABC-type branched-subunit amino acid transport system substrate-binding protein
MLSPRDRLLAWLFAAQLLAAAVLGVVLVNKVGGNRTVTTVVGQAGPAPTASAAGVVPTAGPVASVAAVPGGRSITTTTTGNQGGRTTTVTKGQVLKPGAPIKIGVLVTQTGAINFAPSAQATKAYVDRVNAAGGVNGHKIELIIMDDQLDQARGQQAAQRMLADGVLAFAAWNAPNTENQIVPFLAANKVPLIGSYGEYAEYHSPWAYAFTAHYGHYGFEMGKWLKEKGATKAGLIYIDNGEAHANAGLEKAVQDGWKAAGGAGTVEMHKEDPTQGVYDDVVTSLQLGGVDGIATILDQTAYNRLQQASDRHSYHPVHVADPLFADPAVTKTSTNEGTWVASDLEFLEAGTPAVQDYVQTVRAAYGPKTPVNWVGEVGWLDAMILVDALRSMGSNITREGLVKAVDGLKNQGYGFASTLHFGPGERDINRCLKLGRISGGKLVPATGWSCDGQPF